MAAAGFAAAGAWVGHPFGLGLVVIGAALLLSAVLLPTAREMTLGFPNVVSVKAAIRTREETLRDEFNTRKPELELCAHLLCTDPKAAALLIEATWSTAARLWKGPTNSVLRLYLLCTLIDLITANERWNTGKNSESLTATALGALAPPARTAVVLHEYTKLTTNQIATITRRPVEHVHADLIDSAQAVNNWRAT